jgi:hypothetical protein
VQKFRSDYAELKSQFELLKAEVCLLATGFLVSHANTESCSTAKRASRWLIKHAVSYVRYKTAIRADCCCPERRRILITTL